MINSKARLAEEVFTHPPDKILTSDPHVLLGEQSKTADCVHSPVTPNVPKGNLHTYGTFSFLQIEVAHAPCQQQGQAS